VGKGTIFQPAPEQLWHLPELQRVPPDEVVLVIFSRKSGAAGRADVDSGSDVDKDEPNLKRRSRPSDWGQGSGGGSSGRAMG
jgi:hypothetical protein